MVCPAGSRLQDEGLSRHEASHAIGSVPSAQTYDVVQNADQGAAQDGMGANLAELQTPHRRKLAELRLMTALIEPPVPGERQETL
jgi:hypothetical protein